MLSIGLLLACQLSLPAQALVGATEDSQQWQSFVVMVLANTGGHASFCTGVVVTPRVILTAGHCVSDAAGTRIYALPRATKPKLMRVSGIAVHPAFRADATRTQVRSIDLALIRLDETLPSVFEAASLAASYVPTEELGVIVTGYGLTVEDQPKTGGKLHAARLRIRPPLSHILLWTHGGTQAPQGACTGDSGAPMWDATGTHVVALVAWASGTQGHPCGDLTQGVLLAPQQSWIAEHVHAWGEDLR